MKNSEQFNMELLFFLHNPMFFAIDYIINRIEV